MRYGVKSSHAVRGATGERTRMVTDRQRTACWPARRSIVPIERVGKEASAGGARQVAVPRGAGSGVRASADPLSAAPAIPTCPSRCPRTPAGGAPAPRCNRLCRPRLALYEALCPKHGIRVLLDALIPTT